MDSSSGGSSSGSPRCLVHIADFANMLKAFIGSNYLTIAFAFHQSGLIPGIVGLVFIAALTDHCCHLIVKCKYKAIEHIVQSQPESDPVKTNQDGSIVIENDYIKMLRKKMHRNLSYGDIGKISYGRWGLYIVNICIFITQFGFCVAYFIFIGNTIQALFPLKTCSEVNGTSICTPYESPAHAGSIGKSVISVEKLKASSNNSTFSTNSSDYTESSMEGYYGSPLLQLETLQITQDLAANITNITHTTIQSTAPSLKLLVLIPLPIFIAFSYVRNVRSLGGISVGANLSIFVGAVSVMVYLLIDFHISPSFEYVSLEELPMFFGLVTSSFEGIGTIIPIESSMEGNRHNFSSFLHGAVGTLAAILLAFGVLGYLRFGDHTSQMINTNIPSSSAIAMAVNICLCIGVILTFPLQIFPVIELTEIFLFADGKVCGPKRKRATVGGDDEESEGYASGDYDDRDTLLPAEGANTAHIPVATVISNEVSTLRRNTARLIVVGVAAGLAVLFKDKFAYISAFTGSIGSSLLAYILPCLFYLKLGWTDMPFIFKLKNIIIIVLGIFCSIISLYASVRSLFNDTTST